MKYVFMSTSVLLLALIAYNTFVIAAHSTKEEERQRIDLQLRDCNDACPPHIYDIREDHREQNEANAKCTATCDGKALEKYHTLLK